MVKKKVDIEFLLNHIRAGKKPISLVKQLNISKQLLSYYLRTLKSKGIIRKVTNGVWEIVKDNLKLSSKVIRGHAFIWIIKLPVEIKNWKDREEILTKNSIPFTKTGNTIRLIIKGKKVWLNNKSIIIYEPKYFYASLPLESRKLAVYELREEIKAIENTIGINLSGFKVKTKREHYALVKNDLAKQVNKEGEKIHLYDDGEWWGDIDKSMGGDEFEFFKTKSFSGLTNSTGANNYFNSHKNTNWQVTPKFVLNVMNGIQQNQLVFAKNMESHISSIKTLGQEVRGLSRAIRSIKKENLKLKLGNQKTLLEY